MAENELNWPSADILVSYDTYSGQIRYTAISTGRLLKVVSVGVPNGLQNGDCITPTGVVRPYIDLSPVAWWRRGLSRFSSWIRALKEMIWQ